MQTSTCNMCARVSDGKVDIKAAADDLTTADSS